MDSDRVLFRGGYQDRDRLYLVSLNSQRSQELAPTDPSGERIADFRAFARGSCFYLRTNVALFVIDAATLPSR